MTKREPLSPEAVERLIAATEPWLSCDDCFEQIDAAIDKVVDSTGSMSEELRVHLSACAVCCEEARSLAALVAEEHGLSPAGAIARLDASMRIR
ncbi:hypothetical protein ACFHYQ_04570 [Sphaerimonospora cavernae]|uniref:Zinc-finger domain-containing protein n=1 Tax=Sphaerimonospora cavernae TaxID=1740611 RepID=A0ABV6TZC5_9ACTN